MTAPIDVVEEKPSNAAARKSFALVFVCTLIGAIAQILMKKGTLTLGAHVTLSQVMQNPALFIKFAMGIVTNVNLFVAYALYGLFTLLMSVALRGRELSRLYPIIALTYVWVTILSLFILPGEHLNGFRTAGIFTIVGGVSILGMKK